jgi:short-subunit dehydrogenase
MTARLKPIEDQVVVLTGASSGIGLATARLLAERGARLVLVSRNADALERVAQEIRLDGGEAVAVQADVARHDDLERVAETAIERFGGIDTWINNAGVSVYGTVDEIPLADQRRVFDVNYWGVVQGSLVAARHLRRKGGAIINTGSVLSDHAVILQGPYSATKHAVKGFTDALRMELEAEGAPISVTLIKPSAIDTPFFEHARSYLDSRGVRNPPPAYDPHLVAKAMLYACEHPKRDLVVGMGGFMISLMGGHFPRLTDRLLEMTMVAGQESDVPAPSGWRDNLYAPRKDGEEHSRLPGPGPRRTSLYLAAQMHPVATAAVMAGVGLGIAALLRSARRPVRRGPVERDGRLDLPRGEW